MQVGRLVYFWIWWEAQDVGGSAQHTHYPYNCPSPLVQSPTSLPHYTLCLSPKTLGDPHTSLHPPLFCFHGCSPRSPHHTSLLGILTPQPHRSQQSSNQPPRTSERPRRVPHIGQATRAGLTRRPPPRLHRFPSGTSNHNPSPFSLHWAPSIRHTPPSPNRPRATSPWTGHRWAHVPPTLSSRTSSQK